MKTIEEKAKAYDESVAYAKRVLDDLAEDYRCTHMTKDDIKNQYSRLFPHEDAFRDDEDSFVRRKLIYGLRSLIQQGKETFAGADIGDLINYLEKKKEPFKEPIDGVLYAAACGIKNKGQIEKSENPMEHKDIDTEICHWMGCLDDRYCMLVNHYSIQDIKDTARHFAQWGAEHAMK